METYLQKLAVEVLADTGLSEIPRESKASKIWSKAIGVTRLRSGNLTLALLERVSEEEYHIKKVYGSEISPIHKIESVRPYLFIDKLDLPKFKSGDRHGRLDFISHETSVAEADKVANEPIAVLDDIIRALTVKAAIRKSINRDEELRKGGAR